MREFLEQFGLRFGDVLVMITIIGTFLRNANAKAKADAVRDITLQSLSSDMRDLKSDAKEFRRALEQVSNQKVQIDFLIKAYDELRHGQGLVMKEH